MNLKMIGLLIIYILPLQCSNFDYKKWWQDWYAKGNTSGSGSRGVLAQFKADVINDFIEKKSITNVVEFGCGDGVNLGLINYKKYLGLDVSSLAIHMCNQIYKDDITKNFLLYDPLVSLDENLKKGVDLVVCLDVLYHITDEIEYVKVLDEIFSFNAPYIILYTSLTKERGASPYNGPEMCHRDILPYLQKYSNYEFYIIKQKYPHLSSADFIILEYKTK